MPRAQPVYNPFWNEPYEEHDFGATIAPEVMPVLQNGVVGTPEMVVEYAKLMYGKPDTLDVRERFAKYILQKHGEQTFNAATAVHQWHNSQIYIDTQRELDKDPDAINEELPSKNKMSRDVYNMAQNDRVSADDRLKAFRLYGEIQGFVQKGGVPVVNVDNRSIILVPTQARRGTYDPEREQQIVDAQARLITDATKD